MNGEVALLEVGLFSARGLLTRIISAILEEDGHHLYSSRYWSIFEKGAKNHFFDLLLYDCPGQCPFSKKRCLILADMLRTPCVVISPDPDHLKNDLRWSSDFAVLQDPFYPVELLQIIREMVNRYDPIQKNRPAPFREHHRKQLVIADEKMIELSPVIFLDTIAEVLIHEGLRLQLSSREYRLLETLLRNEGKVVDYDTLLTAIWGDEDKGSFDNLYTVVRSLRKKLGDKGDPDDIIQNKYGRGYVLKRREVKENEKCYGTTQSLQIEKKAKKGNSY